MEHIYQELDKHRVFVTETGKEMVPYDVVKDLISKIDINSIIAELDEVFNDSIKILENISQNIDNG